MKTVSVLIAAYRAERWLEEGLASIKAQNLPAGWEREILVGVDGCAGTLDAAMALKSEGVRIIALKNNCGPYVTFNTLMEHARGDAICRFDADDVMKQGYLAEQLKLLDEGADMTMTWCILTDENLNPVSSLMAHIDYQVDNGEYRREVEGQFMIRREVWNALGGFLPWRCGADTDFYKRIRVSGFQVNVIEQFLYFHRAHAESLTAHPATDFQSETRKHYIALMKEYREEYSRHVRPVRVEPVTAEIAGVYD